MWQPIWDEAASQAIEAGVDIEYDESCLYAVSGKTGRKRKNPGSVLLMKVHSGS